MEKEQNQDHEIIPFIRTPIEDVRKFRNHTENGDVVHIGEIQNQKII